MDCYLSRIYRLKQIYCNRNPLVNSFKNFFSWATQRSFATKNVCFLGFFFLFLFSPFCFLFAAESQDIVINEVMWKGSPEWIELYNATGQNIEIEGWEIAGAKTGGGSLKIENCKKSPCLIKAGSYFLITDKESGIFFDLEESISLKDKGNNDLVLRDENGKQIDLAKGDEWPAGGKEEDDVFSMERINPAVSGANKDNWAQSKEPDGTPRTKNSQFSDEIPEPLFADAGVGIISQTDKEIIFDASGSTGKIQEYLWNFGDGNEGQGKIVTHSYGLSGRYLVSLTVNNGNESKKDIIEVAIFSSGVFISEFSSKEKWVEIVNFSDNIQNISGWEITDEKKESGFLFPEDSYIFPGSFILVPSSLLSKISFSKDVLFFLYPTGDARQEIKFDNSFNEFKDGWSVARKGEDYFYTKTQTKGMPNIISGQEKASNLSNSIGAKEDKNELARDSEEPEEEAHSSSQENYIEAKSEETELFGEIEGTKASLPQKKIFNEDVFKRAKTRKKDLILSAAGISLFSGFFGFGIVRLRRKLKNSKDDSGNDLNKIQKELIEVEVVN